MMRPNYGGRHLANSDISPEPIRNLNVPDLNIVNNENNNNDDGLFIGPIQLSFSSSTAPESDQQLDQQEEDDENLLNTTTTSSSTDSVYDNSDNDSMFDTDDEEDEDENGIDLDAIMRHIDDCGRHIKRNLTDIVRVELENLLNSLQPRQPLVPYDLSSDEEEEE